MVVPPQEPGQKRVSIVSDAQCHTALSTQGFITGDWQAIMCVEDVEVGDGDSSRPTSNNNNTAAQR